MRDIYYVAFTPRARFAKMSSSGQNRGQTKYGERKCYREIQTDERNPISTLDVIQAIRT